MAGTEVDTPAPDPPAQAGDDSVVALVGRHYPTLSPSHRRVADFILASPHQAALMTLDDIADATGVSKATANRLAARIGLPGYPELKRRLRAQLQQALSPVEDLLGTLRVQNFSRTAPWTQSILEDLERLRSIDAVGGDAAFTRACALLARAGRVFPLGLGSSAFIAAYAAFALATLRDGVHSVADASGVEGAVRRLGDASAKDAALLISFARYSAESLRLAELLHAQRVPIVCVADSPVSPVARLADSCFIVERKPGFVVSSSGTGAMAVVEALIRGTAAAIGAEAVEARAGRLTELLGNSVIEPKA